MPGTIARDATGPSWETTMHERVQFDRRGGTIEIAEPALSFTSRAASSSPVIASVRFGLYVVHVLSMEARKHDSFVVVQSAR